MQSCFRVGGFCATISHLSCLAQLAAMHDPHSVIKHVFGVCLRPAASDRTQCTLRMMPVVSRRHADVIHLQAACKVDRAALAHG